jgi:polysaccharide biosynthesis protein PslJ
VRTAGLPVGIADVAPEVRMWRRSWGGGRLAPVGWPLFALLIGLPLWWFLGVSAFIAPLLALPLVLALVERREVLAPAGFGWWILFLMWAIVTATQLDGLRDWAAFSYRLLGYLGATVVFLYLINVPRALLSTRTVVKAMAGFWVVVVAGGMLGVFLPAFSFTTVTEALLPGVLLQDSFVHDMVRASTSSAKAFAAYPIFRPKAPLPYTNIWASVYALTLPFAFAALTMGRFRVTRWKWLGLIAVSLVPFIFSLSRGAWLSVAAAGAYALFRLLGRGKVRVLLGAVAILLLVGGVLLFTPLGDIILVRWGAGYSNEGRLNIYMESLRLAQASPIFGFGAPVSVPGLPSAGTHGQLWTVLVSHGIPGTVLFLGGLLWIAVRSGRALWSEGARGTTVRFWTHLVVVIALAQLPFYALLPWGLLIVMVAAGLFWREALPQQAAPTRAPAWGSWSPTEAWAPPAGVGPVPALAILAGPRRKEGPRPLALGQRMSGGAITATTSSVPIVRVVTPSSSGLPQTLTQAGEVRTARRRPLPAFLQSRGLAWLGTLTLVAATLMLILTRPDRETAIREPARATARSGESDQPAAVPTRPSTFTTPGPGAIVLPDLRGLTFAEAVAQLEDMDLVVGGRILAEGEPGIVVATDPGLGRLVRPGRRITLYVGG